MKLILIKEELEKGKVEITESKYARDYGGTHDLKLMDGNYYPVNIIENNKVSIDIEDIQESCDILSKLPTGIHYQIEGIN